MPRAALLSIHARVEGTKPSTWEDPSLVQLWGPRYSAYVVAARDLAVFSLGRLPDGGASPAGRGGHGRAAARPPWRTRMTDGEAGRALGVHPTGCATPRRPARSSSAGRAPEQPTIWTVPPPQIDPRRGPPRARAPVPARLRPHDTSGVRRWAGIGVRGRSGVRRARQVPDAGADPDRRRVDPLPRRAGLPRRPRARGPRAAPPERRRLLPAPGSRSRAPGTRRRHAAPCSGHRASGRAPCSSRARSSARGGGRRRR